MAERSPPTENTLPRCAPDTGARKHRSRRSAALPDFTFNPAAAGIPNIKPIITPPHSPASQASPTTPSGLRGHRRGGSEFIGGNGKGGAGLLSTSPVRCDADQQTLTLSSRLAATSGRGHRHRRSGAISCHDLQTIMHIREGGARSGSAPATPLEAGTQSFYGLSSRNASRDDGAPSSTVEHTGLPVESLPPKAVPRVRVGFADRVEYIRPLSTISSGTESSMSTIRGTHSVSGSLSSVLSSTASPPSMRASRPPPLHINLAQETTFEQSKGSPFVIDALTMDDAEQTKQQAKTLTASTAIPDQVPLSPVEGVKTPKRRSFGWWDSKRANDVLRSSCSEPSLLPSPPVSPDTVDQISYTAVSEDMSSSDVDRPSKQKRSRIWTRSLLARRSKSHCSLKGKVAGASSPIPAHDPHPRVHAISPYADRFLFHEIEPIETESFEPDLDIDETVTIISEHARPKLSLSTMATRLQADADPMSPVIDLNAALGPFHTPSFGANTRSEAARPQPRPQRSLRALGYQSSLNHRRAESAPQLEPFEHRNGKEVPAKPMPDVFEEEEGDDEQLKELGQIGDEERNQEEIGKDDSHSDGFAVGLVSGKEASALGISAPSANTDNENVYGESTAQTESACIPPCTHQQRALSPSNSTSSNSERTLSVIHVVEDEEPPTSPFTRHSDSTVTPPLDVGEDKSPRLLMSLQLPLITTDTLTGSFSSQGFSGSQASLSMPRLGTATSSTTDSRSMTSGEPVLALRSSVDDVPSLSSSRSTMTTPPQHPFIFADPYEQRTASVASIDSLERQRRRSKRASVASLSRLIGVRSKLSTETRPQSQHAMSTRSATPKIKKANRLSKLVNFLKRQPSSNSRQESILS